MTENSSPAEDTTRPILVPVDFSPSSECALAWAARAARCLNAPLLVLHVVHDPEAAPGYYQRAKKHKKHLRRMEEAAQEMMVDFVSTAHENHPEIPAPEDLSQQLIAGLPTTRILEVAEHTGAQLIVMGSRGRTGLNHVLLGSKAEKIAQLSPIPVTIVKAPQSIDG